MHTIAVGVAVLLLIQLVIHRSVDERIVKDTRKVPPTTVAIVLGTQALPNGRLSERLTSRCDKAVELYKAGKARKLLMSGANQEHSNFECDAMRSYAISNGVSPKDVEIDGLGLRTYDSMYRAKHVFGIKRMIVVTQGFHMDRSLFYCKAVGINAHGVPADCPASLRDRLREPLAVVLSLG